MFECSYQQVTVAAETDPGAHHPLYVDVRAQGLDVPETALQRALPREQSLQPEKRRRDLSVPNVNVHFKATLNHQIGVCWTEVGGSDNSCCAYYSLGRHLVLWYSSQVVAATEQGDVFCERVGVEVDAVVPHHDTVTG